MSSEMVLQGPQKKKLQRKALGLFLWARSLEFTKPVEGPDVGKAAGESRKDAGKTPVSIRQELQVLLEQLGENVAENIRLLRSEYGVFMEYLWAVNGVNPGQIVENFDERLVWILMLISLTSSISMQRMANMLGVSISTIKKDIKNLENANVISHQGSYKSGNWSIVMT